MNYLDKYLEFETVEDGEKKLTEAQALRDKMNGALYWGALNDDCQEIKNKIWKLIHKKNETNTLQPEG